MNPAPGEKSAIDRLLEVGVFAPLGFLLTRDKAIADFAAAGRKQIAFSRSLGRVAIKGLLRGTQGSQPEPTKVAANEQVPEPDPKSGFSGAIADYDSKTAREVIALIGECDDRQIDWIRARETERKNRVTVLRALDARQSS